MSKQGKVIDFFEIDKRQRDFEARVSNASYYVLILSILAMLFLVLVSIIGELFERLTGTSGYIGAVIASAIKFRLFLRNNGSVLFRS